jgi:nucleoside-diphosphate-sugar epimerase
MRSVDVFAGDLIDTRDWSGFLSGVDVVIHAAAEIRHPDLMMAVNVQGPERLLHAALAKGVRRWVQLSSVGAYGPSVSGVVDESTPEKPEGPYEKTKTLFDQMLRDASEQTQLEVCIVRPSNVYGPSMGNQSLIKLMSMIRRGWFTFLGPPGASANYVHVNDVVSALVLCAQHPEAVGKTFIVSDWSTIESMVGAIASGMCIDTPTRRMGLALATFLSIVMQWLPVWPLTKGRVRALSGRAQYSTTSIENILGWQRCVPLEIGMRELSNNWVMKKLCANEVSIG